MQREPAFTSNLAEIVLMGGSAFGGGNASPAAEANILNDPEAADIVFGAGCPIVMAGLDVTEQTVMTTDDLATIGTFDNARARHLAAIVPYYATFYLERHDFHGIFVHDSSTISYLLAPEHFSGSSTPFASIAVTASAGKDPDGHPRQRPRVAMERTTCDPNPHPGRLRCRGCAGIGATTGLRRLLDAHEGNGTCHSIRK
jgi:hypothetical protein